MTDILQQLRDLITRTDPALPPLTREQLALDGEDERRRVATGIAQTHVGAAMTLQAMAVYDGFLAASGLTSLVDAPPSDALHYVEAAEGLTAQHLRRNSLHACYAVEAVAGRLEVPDELVGMRIEAARDVLGRPSQSPSRSGASARAQTVCATTDEVLVMRTSTPSHARRTPTAVPRPWPSAAAARASERLPRSASPTTSSWTRGSRGCNCPAGTWATPGTAPTSGRARSGSTRGRTSPSRGARMPCSPAALHPHSR